VKIALVYIVAQFVEGRVLTEDLKRICEDKFKDLGGHIIYGEFFMSYYTTGNIM